MGESHGSSVRVLLADDEPEFLAPTAAALRRRHFDVVTAEDGQRALETLAQQPIDVAVLDVRMPEIGGLDLLRRVRREWPAVQVVILTGHPSVREAAVAEREGLFEYLAKPCDVEQLTAVLRRAAERGRSNAQPRSGVEARDTSLRLLVVDGDVDLLEHLSREFGERQMAVSCAAGPAEALAKLNFRAFDVALVDMNQPGMNGLDLFRHIKSKHSDTEVIVMTGPGTLLLAELACREGAYYYLLKPLDVDWVASRIRDASSRRGARLAQERERWARGVMNG